MIKKSLSVLMLATLSISLVGCGGKKEATTTTETIATEATEAVKKTEATTEATTEEPEEIPRISGGQFTDGNFFLTAEYTDGQKGYVYNLTSGETTPIVDEYVGIFAEEYLDGTISGFGTHIQFTNQIVDITTGENYVEGEYEVTQGYLNSKDSMDDDLAMLMQCEEAFEGNTYTMGVINGSGEWIVPWTTDVPWNPDEMGMRYIDNGWWLRDSNVLYNANENQLYSNENLTNELGLPFCVINDTLICSNNSGICKLDKTIGEITFLAEGGAGFKATWTDFNNYCNLNYTSMDGKYIVGAKATNGVSTIFLCDENGNIATEYDLTEYAGNGVVSVYGVTDTMFIGILNNGEAEYFCVMEPSGEMIFEPVKREEFILSGKYAKVIVDDNQLVCVGYKKVLILDLDTKEYNIYENDMEYWNYDTESNMFLVKANHPEYGSGLYLLNRDDMNTLIHPLAN